MKKEPVNAEKRKPEESKKAGRNGLLAQSAEDSETFSADNIILKTAMNDHPQVKQN